MIAKHGGFIYDGETYDEMFPLGEDYETFVVLKINADDDYYLILKKFNQ